MKAFWTVVIVIIALAVVGYGGYRVYHHYTWKPTPTPAAMKQSNTMKPAPSMAKSSASAMTGQNSVYKTASDPKLGTIMVDQKGMTLYTFTKDKPGVSNCSGGCLKAWPAYNAQSDKGTFPANITVIKRSDGRLQYAWKGMPLYYFSSDTKSGDVTGQGVGGVWNVVKL
jgi:predicted lipoprotein with Yx(FWY)xxD motif